MFCSEFKGQGNKKLKLCAIRRRKTTQELLMEKDNKNNNLSTSPSLHPPIKTIIRPLTTVFRQTSNSARLLAEIGERKNFGSNRSVGTAVGRLNKETELIEMKSTDRNSGSNQKMQIDAPAADERNCPIKLSVYNIQKQFRIYHVGVLVRGREFHYGMRIGVFTCEPANGQKTFHVKYWRKMIHWRIEFIKCMALLTHFPLTTTMSLEELEKVQRELGQKYMRANYHLLNHNCLDFAREFIRRITTKQPPNWIWPQELRQPLIIMPVRLVFRVEQRKALRKEKQKHDNNSNADGDYASSTLSTTPMVLLRQHVQQQIPYITNIKIKYNGD